MNKELPRLGAYIERRTPYIVAAAMAPYDLSLGTMQRQYIRSVVRMLGGNITLAASVLRVSRRSLERNGFGASPPKRRKQRTIKARRARSSLH